jgi:hypothetical protein
LIAQNSKMHEQKVETPFSELNYEGSNSPKSCRSHHNHETHSDQPPGKIGLAPALEHGHQSNDKEHNGNCANGFKPHVWILTIQHARIRRQA